MTVFYDRKGRQLPAGERPFGYGDGGVFQGPMAAPGLDRKLDKPKRPCASCGRTFQPTDKRRLLCVNCFGRASSSPMEPG